MTLKRLMWKSLESAVESTTPPDVHRSVVPQLTNAICERNTCLLNTTYKNLRDKLTLTLRIGRFTQWYSFWNLYNTSTAAYLYCPLFIVLEQSTSRVACRDKYAQEHHTSPTKQRSCIAVPHGSAEAWESIFPDCCRGFVLTSIIRLELWMKWRR